MFCVIIFTERVARIILGTYQGMNLSRGNRSWKCFRTLRTCTTVGFLWRKLTVMYLKMLYDFPSGQVHNRIFCQLRPQNFIY